MVIFLLPNKKLLSTSGCCQTNNENDEYNTTEYHVLKPAVYNIV